MRARQILVAGGLLACLGLSVNCSFAREPSLPNRIEFNRDIRPILSDNCFQCHGPDGPARQGGLRLDQEAQAKQPLESGAIAIVPGDPQASSLVQRITANDPDERMPPADSTKKLSKRQIALVRRWIEQGAEYQPHWSLVSLKPVPIPEATAGARIINPIDAFVQARLLRENLPPSPEADRATLIRRVSFDLNGLPPTLAEIDAFVSDKSPDAYERLVDRLLASPRFGERLAQDWLDAARYADTHGFNNDFGRTMWRWRDWVIDSFNRNLTFDRFLTEQLAGDLLPQATFEQRLASGFNRNHVINSEGGIIPEEYRVEYVADRVSTVGSVFLGLSIGCARCHDHKFDPITQREYYQLFAFFNNVDEVGEDGGNGNAKPWIKAPTVEQSAQLSQIAKEQQQRQKVLDQHVSQVKATAIEWESTLRARCEEVSKSAFHPAIRLHLDETSGSEVHDTADSASIGKLVGAPSWTLGRLGNAMRFDGHTIIDCGDRLAFDRQDAFSYGAWINPESNSPHVVLARMDDAHASRGYDLIVEEAKPAVHLISRWPDSAIKVRAKNPVPLNQWSHVLVTYDGSSKASGIAIYVNGERQELQVIANRLKGSFRSDVSLSIGRRSSDAPFVGMIDEVTMYTRRLSADEASLLAHAPPILDVLAIAAEHRTPEQSASIFQQCLDRFDDEYRNLKSALNRIKRERDQLDQSIPTAMVMEEMPEPRPTFVLQRGQYDAPDKTQQVQPGVPASLPPLPAGAPPNRLGLAQWLTSPEHPLTARVAVNRYWQMYFGVGLVETSEDFGAQGQWPSDPQLLDWLAGEFIRSGWDIKALQRLIVTSATYRQSSRVSKPLLERDPQNRLLARGPRFRLPAESIRDNALAISGLLHEKLGGPSVMPYQPAGLWEDVIPQVPESKHPEMIYRQAHDDGLYRRSMYTVWKRNCPPPGLNTFDAPEREVCLMRRARTNTPLQALVMLNDPTFLEAARVLAERMMTEGGDGPNARLVYGFQLATARVPKEVEQEILLKAWARQLTRFRKDAAAAKALISIGVSPRKRELGEAELAAWTTVASMILNLDETITKS